MKVLVSAIACDPYQGSENYFGWAAVQCLAREHELWVITSSGNRASLERAGQEGLVPEGVRFEYAGPSAPWHPSRLRARIQSWREYAAFARESLPVAWRLHAEQRFALVHHVTFSTWRVPSPMWRLGIPLVLGPLAGNEPFPFRLFPILSGVAAAFELARKASNVISPWFPKVRESVRRAAHVFAITTEAEDLLVRMRGSAEGVTRLSPGFYTAERAEGFARVLPGKQVEGPLRLYAAGNLGGQKCISVALRGLALAKERGVRFRYLLGSSGPEVPHLQELACRLDLEQEVVFGQNTSREEYQEELGRTHVYLLPSMRETVGLTMLEAMLAGCVPIVADTGGPKVTVTEDCGYRIPVAGAHAMAEGIARVLAELDGNRELLREKGRLASARVREVHSAENYLARVGEVYRRVVGRR